MFHSRHAIRPVIFIIAFITLSILGLTVAWAQEPEALPTPVLPDMLYEYANLNLPAHYNAPPLPAIDNTPANNPVTNQGAMLGRVLFYDKRMSANNSVACASCTLRLTAFQMRPN